jgi:hypothetical protein
MLVRKLMRLLSTSTVGPANLASAPALRPAPLPLYALCGSPSLVWLFSEARIRHFCAGLTADCALRLGGGALSLEAA